VAAPRPVRSRSQRHGPFANGPLPSEVALGHKAYEVSTTTNPNLVWLTRNSFRPRRSADEKMDGVLRPLRDDPFDRCERRCSR